MNKVLASSLAFAFAALFFSLSAHGQVRTPEELPGAFVKAWHSHDATGKGFAAIYADDAHFLPVAEIPVVIGGKAIYTGLGETVGSAWAKVVDTAIKGTPVVHRLSDDVAVIFWHAELIENGKAWDRIDRANIFVAVRKGGEWRITDHQLTKQNPDAPAGK